MMSLIGPNNPRYTGKETVGEVHSFVLAKHIQEISRLVYKVADLELDLASERQRNADLIASIDTILDLHRAECRVSDIRAGAANQ